MFKLINRYILKKYFQQYKKDEILIPVELLDLILYLTGLKVKAEKVGTLIRYSINIGTKILWCLE